MNWVPVDSPAAPPGRDPARLGWVIGRGQGSLEQQRFHIAMQTLGLHTYHIILCFTYTGTVALNLVLSLQEKCLTIRNKSDTESDWIRSDED